MQTIVSRKNENFSIFISPFMKFWNLFPVYEIAIWLAIHANPQWAVIQENLFDVSVLQEIGQSVKLCFRNLL